MNKKEYDKDRITKLREEGKLRTFTFTVKPTAGGEKLIKALEKEQNKQFNILYALTQYYNINVNWEEYGTFYTTTKPKAKKKDDVLETKIQQQKALNMFLVGRPISNIADELEVTPRTIYRWLKYPIQAKEREKVKLTPYAKTSEIRKARQLKKEGKSYRAIAKILDCHASTVYRWINKKNETKKEKQQ